MDKQNPLSFFTKQELSNFTLAEKTKLLQLIQQPFSDTVITPMLVPTIPITPAQESTFLSLMQTFRDTVNAYLTNPISANNIALRNSMTALYNFLLNEFPTQQGRDATRYSLFLFLTINNRLISASPTQVFQIATMLQSLYTTLSILISEFIMTNTVRNQLLDIVATLVSTTSTVSGGGSTGPTIPIGDIHVANNGSNNVSVIDGNLGIIGQVIATIPVGVLGSTEFPIAVNIANNRIYVANRSSNNVSVIGVQPRYV